LSAALRAISGEPSDRTPKRYADAIVLSPVDRLDHAPSEGFKVALLPRILK
jgi:hypothetical protein